MSPAAGERDRDARGWERRQLNHVRVRTGGDTLEGDLAGRIAGLVGAGDPLLARGPRSDAVAVRYAERRGGQAVVNGSKYAERAGIGAGDILTAGCDDHVVVKRREGAITRVECDGEDFGNGKHPVLRRLQPSGGRKFVRLDEG